MALGKSEFSETWPNSLESVRPVLKRQVGIATILARIDAEKQARYDVKGISLDTALKGKEDIFKDTYGIGVNQLIPKKIDIKDMAESRLEEYERIGEAVLRDDDYKAYVHSFITEYDARFREYYAEKVATWEASMKATNSRNLKNSKR